MWWKWFPLKFIVRVLARRQGFLDPIKIISQLQNFAQPSEVAAPLELVRSGVVLHARGLINSLAIQHNLDWIWPYWVECQYNPKNDAFIPRAFSLTQINLTHRNWTALGIPDSSEFSIVDPRGLVTPCYDGWSLDAWIIPSDGLPLIPSRLSSVSQQLLMDDGLCVQTESGLNKLKLHTQVKVIGSAQSSVCKINIKGLADQTAWLVIALRPYNPEGVSFIHDIALLENQLGWQVNRKDFVYFDIPPNRYEFSYYHHGDVYNHLPSSEDKRVMWCKVGMSTAAALYKLETGVQREVIVSVPLTKNKKEKQIGLDVQDTSKFAWDKSIQGACLLQIPDKHFQFLFEAAVRTMVLHSPKEVYPGPYIYRRFWFRDAAFILYALLCVGLKERVRRALDCFRSRQTVKGYFLSQEGEWDSNGEALWIMDQYCRMTGEAPPEEWKESILKAGKWICKKRLSTKLRFLHAGLLPSGFSAEHLGPNDFYYWDDFWGIAGLNAAASLCNAYKENKKAVYFESQSNAFMESVKQSLNKVDKRLIRPAIPASPYRRMDTGAIGSLVASYPLRIFESNDLRILNTADFLMKNCLIHGGFFHNMTHSGINPYLTLHLSQVLLRAGDPRYFGLIQSVANLSTSTGQWPESIHPRTGGGCMGDGQHVWAAAEWVLMMKNCFVREEGERLILFSGILPTWLDENQTISFGPALTIFGEIKLCLKPKGRNILAQWSGQWLAKEPLIDIQLPGYINVRVSSGTNSIELKNKDQ